MECTFPFLAVLIRDLPPHHLEKLDSCFCFDGPKEGLPRILEN